MAALPPRAEGRAGDPRPGGPAARARAGVKPSLGAPVTEGQSPEVDAPAEMHPYREHHHRNVQGGAARAAVFGISDGLVTNVSLILGVAGGQASASFVRLAGLAGLLAGAFSMAAGEYVSMSAQSELLHRELEIERRALRTEPEAEEEELAQVYERRGLTPEAARNLAQLMMRTPELALEAHAREEIGVDPSSIASPYPAAAASFVSFSLGAVIPLVPWFFMRGGGAVGVSIGLVVIVSVVLGLLLAQATGRSSWRSALRQVVVSMLAAGVTYGVGRLVGVGVHG